MRRQKRDMNSRAFQRGYQAGIDGRSSESCPHASDTTRHFWLTGWREGRADHWDGYTGLSALPKTP